MPFIDSIPVEAATGDVAAMYETDQAAFGFMPNFTAPFSHRPAIYAAWRQLNGAIKATMDLRRYELATVAAARRLGSTYCAVAHGSVLLDQFVDAETLRAIVADHRSAGLDELDVAVMDLADKVAQDAGSVQESDIQRLRGLGLSDAEIFEVVAAAAARCFFSKMLDGLGVQADARYAQRLDPELLDVLTVGRPIAAAQP